MRYVVGFGLAAALATLVSAADPQKAEYDPRDSGPDSIDVSKYPEDQQRRYDVMVAKCVKCHPLARTVNSRFNSRQWKRYMKRMLRRPNSGVNEEQAQRVYEFLKFHSAKIGVPETGGE
jgi:hypothetical protein